MQTADTLKGGSGAGNSDNFDKSHGSVRYCIGSFRCFLQSADTLNAELVQETATTLTSHTALRILHRKFPLLTASALKDGTGAGNSDNALNRLGRTATYLQKLESIASSAVRAADKVAASLIIVYTQSGDALLRYTVQFMMLRYIVRQVAASLIIVYTQSGDALLHYTGFKKRGKTRDKTDHTTSV